jgi:phytanoyl-CoA hydroxylase
MSAMPLTPLRPPAVPLRADRTGAAAGMQEFRDFTLTAAEVRRFGEDGYLVVPALCEAAEQDRIRCVLTQLFARHAGREEGNQFDMLSADRDEHAPLQPQILKPSLYAPALLHGVYFQRVQAIARQLLGSDAVFNFDHSILKPAGRPVATPWHQDEAHRHDPLFHSEQVSFWMPLQDVTEHNGCMRYIPGSQLGPLLPHQSADNDPQVHALECSEAHFDASRARAQPVPAGWCILHGGRTLHSALPNHSDADRLGLHRLVLRTAAGAQHASAT